MKNVGLIDRVLRFLLGVFLVVIGLFWMDGIHGKIAGLITALSSLLPFYMALTASCFVFRWLNINSLPKKESDLHGVDKKANNNT